MVIFIILQSSCATEYSPSQLQALLYGSLDELLDTSSDSFPVSSLATEHLADGDLSDYSDEESMLTRHLLAAAPAEAGTLSSFRQYLGWRFRGCSRVPFHTCSAQKPLKSCTRQSASFIAISADVCAQRVLRQEEST